MSPEDAWADGSALTNDSVANTSQIVALDRAVLTTRVGKLAPKRLTQILIGIDIILGR